jgi:hypothetical protein
MCFFTASAQELIGWAQFLNWLLNTHVKTHKLWQICSRLVAMLFQQLVNRMCSHCLFPACWQVVNGLLTTCYKVVELNRLTRLLNSTDLLQVVPTTCYRPAIQHVVNKLWVTTLWQLDKITALLQLVDKLATSLLRTHLVDKSWQFYVCRWWTIIR